MAEVERVDGHPQGFQHGAVRVTHLIRQRVQQLVRPGHELPHGPVLLPVPGEPDVQAQVAVALAAGPAGPVRDSRVDGHPLTAPRAFLDHPGRFVAQHQRVIQGRVADPALVPPVQVRAADADGRDPDQALSGPGYRHRLVGQAQIRDRVQPGNPHLVLRLRRDPGGVPGARGYCAAEDGAKPEASVAERKSASRSGKSAARPGQFAGAAGQLPGPAGGLPLLPG